jgi:hypothetical protein
VAVNAALNDDFRDFLHELLDAGVDFAVVGAHALAAHGVTRATGDLDVLLRADPENAARVMRALARFGAPIHAHDVVAADFERPGSIYQMGQPPGRIDLLTAIDGVTWDEVAAGRVERELGGLRVPFLGRAELLRNKASTGRTKDTLDLVLLAEAEGRTWTPDDP